MQSDNSVNASATSSRGAVLGSAIIFLSIACYAAYAWTALVRLGLLDQPRQTAVGVVGLIGLFAIGIASPAAIATVALLLVPFVGNHPGGRLVELINLPLAASAAGLVIGAMRRRLEPPRGLLWLAAGLYVCSALVAIVPTIPAMWMRAAQLNSWPTALADALSAPEDHPLYSLSSALGVTLAVAWAAALAWFRPPSLRMIVRFLIYLFFIVVALGVLDYFGVISLVRSYMLRIDPRKPDVNGLQSLFWNPGWFAWYFVTLFALALGFLWSARSPERMVVGVLLAIAYAFSFVNPQRGGLLAIHVCLCAAGWLALRRSANWRPAIGRAAAIAIVVTAVAGAYAFGLIPRTLDSSVFRLLENPADAMLSNSVRIRLWNAALEMWRAAPLFGIGEGAFAWRFDEYVPSDSPVYSTLHGDAHSTWLQILATRGAFGMLAFAALTWAVGRALVRALKNGPADRGLVIGVSLSLLGFLVYSFVQGMFYIQGIQILFWFLISAAALSSRVASPPIPKWAGPATLVVVVAALAVQGVASAPLFAEASRLIASTPRGFYPTEQSEDGRSWRWSAGGEALLCLQPVRPRASLVLSAGDPRPVSYPRTVTLEINDAVVDRVRLENSKPVTALITMPTWDPHATPARAFGDCTGQPHEVKLTVRVDGTWNPMAEGLAPDPRTLGVQIFEPVWLNSD